MDRYLSVVFLGAMLFASSAIGTPGKGAVCKVPEVDGDGPAQVRSNADLDAWLARCPETLAPLTPGARERFLGQLRFNDRGVVDYPVQELTEALTTDEIAQVSRLLGLDMTIPGLTHEEAERLRAEDLPDGITAIERRFNHFHAESRALERNLDGEERGAALVTLYQSTFPAKASAEAVGAHDLGLLYRAASTAAFYSEDPHMTEVALDAHARLSGLGFSTRSRAAEAMKLLLAVGRVNDARQLAQATPEHRLPELPATHDETGGRHETSVWDPATPEALIRRHISLSPVRIVVRASLGCPYSMAAAEAIASDPELGPLFREHAIWMAPPSELIGHQRLRAWNAAHPHTPMVVATNWSNWPMLHRWEGTPTFHVFRDGKLIDSVTSWPLEEGNRAAVAAALHKAGLR